MFQRRQLHQPHAILETFRELARRQSQSRLAESSRTGERQQAGILQQPPCLGQFFPPPDEGGELQRQVVGRARIPMLAGDGGQPAATIGSYFTGESVASGIGLAPKATLYWL